MSYDIETFTDDEHGTGLKAIIAYDEHCQHDNPRDWDNCWEFFTKERGCISIDNELDPEYLGTHDCEVCDGEGENVNVIDGIEFTTTCKACDGAGWIEYTVESYLRENHDAHLIIPIYKYEHGMVKYEPGTTGNPFSCQWDSGMIGVAIITEAKIELEWKGDIEAALRYLEGECRDYTDWANGHVYEVRIENEDGEILEACGGFYGDEYAEAEAKAMLETEIEAALKERREARYWLERGVETV